MAFPWLGMFMPRLRLRTGVCLQAEPESNNAATTADYAPE
jgi:hypothetical protein